MTYERPMRRQRISYKQSSDEDDTESEKSDEDEWQGSNDGSSDSESSESVHSEQSDDQQIADELDDYIEEDKDEQMRAIIQQHFPSMAAYIKVRKLYGILDEFQNITTVIHAVTTHDFVVSNSGKLARVLEQMELPNNDNYLAIIRDQLKGVNHGRLMNIVTNFSKFMRFAVVCDFVSSVIACHDQQKRTQGVLFSMLPSDVLPIVDVDIAGVLSMLKDIIQKWTHQIQELQPDARFRLSCAKISEFAGILDYEIVFRNVTTNTTDHRRDGWDDTPTKGDKDVLISLNQADVSVRLIVAVTMNRDEDPRPLVEGPIHNSNEQHNYKLLSGKKHLSCGFFESVLHALHMLVKKPKMKRWMQSLETHTVHTLQGIDITLPVDWAIFFIRDGYVPQYQSSVKGFGWYHDITPLEFQDMFYKTLVGNNKHCVVQVVLMHHEDHTVMGCKRIITSSLQWLDDNQPRYKAVQDKIKSKLIARGDEQQAISNSIVDELKTLPQYQNENQAVREKALTVFMEPDMYNKSICKIVRRCLKNA